LDSDLKPDNLLLDGEGHVHLTDFNIAVRCKDTAPLRSVTGSMAYMAPEVVGRKGYFSSPDWWSIGVVMYELLFAKRPFRGKNNEALTNSILSDPLVFPSKAESSITPDTLNLIRGVRDTTPHAYGSWLNATLQSGWATVKKIGSC
jgi:serine/threonine kinase 32